MPGRAGESFAGDAEEKIIGETGQRDDGFAGGAMVLGQGGDERAGANFAFAQAGAIGLVREADEARVEAAFENGAGLRERREIEKVNGGFGRTAAKAFQDGRCQRMEQTPNVAEVQLRVAGFAGFARDTDGFFALPQQGLRLREERAARFRELDAAPRAVEQCDAQFVLKLPNLAAQGGLRHVQLLRRAGEVEFTRHGGEIAQMTQFHKVIMPPKHDRGNKEVLAGIQPMAHDFNQ